VIGQIADLTASAIKRQAGVKDYADTVPTQGGILDLYDAFIFAAPLWFIFRAHLVPNTL
jgi:phosphatidate cytidylyltransferase